MTGLVESGVKMVDGKWFDIKKFALFLKNIALGFILDISNKVRKLMFYFIIIKYWYNFNLLANGNNLRIVTSVE